MTHFWAFRQAVLHSQPLFFFCFVRLFILPIANVRCGIFGLVSWDLACTERNNITYISFALVVKENIILKVSQKGKIFVWKKICKNELLNG